MFSLKFPGLIIAPLADLHKQARDLHVPGSMKYWWQTTAQGASKCWWYVAAMQLSGLFYVPAKVWWFYKTCDGHCSRSLIEVGD